jgi:anti-sigma B factor antagonist
VSVRLTIKQMGDVTIVGAEGTVTAGRDASEFGGAIRKLAADGNKKLLLDLSLVSYVDSCGIGEMVSGLTSLSNHGGSMKLKVTKRVQNLLNMTGLHKVFNVYEDEAKAIASFDQP